MTTADLIGKILQLLIGLAIFAAIVGLLVFFIDKAPKKGRDYWQLVGFLGPALGALGRIQEILDLPTEDQHDRDIAPLALTVGAANEALAPEAPAIEFVDVRFAYPESTVADSAEGATGAGAGPTAGAAAPSKSARYAYSSCRGCGVSSQPM